MSGSSEQGRDPYRMAARFYDTVVDPLNAGVRRVALRIDPPAPGWAVLDTGCGTGTALHEYAAAGCEIHGVDVSAAMLERARGRLGSDADLRLADATDLPYADDAFDRVVASMMLHEVPASSRPALLAELGRVVKPEGRIVITDFRFGSLRGMKGRSLRAATWVIERVGGHFAGYRSFREIGGLPALAPASGLEIEKEKIVAGGNLAIYLCEVPR